MRSGPRRRRLLIRSDENATRPGAGGSTELPPAHHSRRLSVEFSTDPRAVFACGRRAGG
jgi:hypothetical protein